MNIFLMRHGQANDGADLDDSRTLTDDGKHQCKQMRRFLHDLGADPTLILCSTMRRAVETAGRMRKHLPNVPLVYNEALNPDGTPEKAWKWIRRIVEAKERNAKHVLVITHDPLIMPLLAAVCFAFSPEHNVFDYGSIAHFHSDTGSLKWFASPKTAGKLRESMLAHELATETDRLTEHLLRQSRRNVLEPLEKSVKQFIVQYLNGYNKKPFAAILFINQLLEQAYQAGAAFAVPMLPSAIKESESDQQAAFIASLPGPDRTAADIQNDLDSSSSTADAESRAEATAITEISTAYHNGMSDVAKSVADHGVDVEKQWLPQPDACPICEENAEDGWIPEDIIFASGDDSPPAHPACRCSIEYR